jgi:hypothetical protein
MQRRKFVRHSSVSASAWSSFHSTYSMSGATAATPATEYCTVSASAWSIQSTAAVISGAPTAQEHSTDLRSVATATASVREQVTSNHFKLRHSPIDSSREHDSELEDKSTALKFCKRPRSTGIRPCILLPGKMIFFHDRL